MISRKLIRLRPRVFMALSAALAAVAICCTQAYSENQDHAAPGTPNHVVPLVRPVPLQDRSPSKPLVSQQWKALVWEAYPHDRQTGPPKPEPVRMGYFRRDWKPLFIDSRLEITEAGKMVLGRLDSLTDHAIDPAPYKIEEIQGAVQKLKFARAALVAANLSPSEHAMDEVFAAVSKPQAPIRPIAAAGSEEKTVAPPEEATRPPLPEQVRLYSEVLKAAAEADIAVSFAFYRYSRDMNPFSEELVVRVLSGENRPMTEVLSEIEPSTQDYLALVKSYVRYRDLTKAEQQRLSGSASVKSGESGNQVRELQKRLYQEGYYNGPVSGHFDHETRQALKDFQSAHQIEPDGVLGRSTREWLKVPFSEKAEMIGIAMRQFRNSPARKFERYVRINIPQFLLEYHKDGRVVETHRVVVGKATGKKVKFRGRLVGENQTPTLNSKIEQVILNPRWYVSDRIRVELDAEAKSDPEWFSKHGYVSWGGNRIFQQPGPKNALGRVKFEFPNVFAVYLHDTPKKGLFARTRRDFSHGCIRVDKALKFAETLLNDDKSPYAQKIDSILRGTNQTFVKLSNPVPILIEYAPVSSIDGHVVFLGDPYGVLQDDESKKT